MSRCDPAWLSDVVPGGERLVEVSSSSVAVAIAARTEDRDGDTPRLIEALADLGVTARAARWDDPAERWSDVALVVVRSTWDYVGRRAEFLAWARSVPRIANPADVLAWNTHKSYLRELEQAGVAVVPTTWVPVGAGAVLPEGDIVVKPVVSNGGRDTARYTSREAAHAVAHIARLHATGRDVMVQPYVTSVDEMGETGVVVIDGSPSHAVAKGPRLASGATANLDGSEGVVASVASPDELDVAAQILARVPGGPQRLLYARVDLVRDANGSPMLMELELTEPSLFLACEEGAAARLAAGVVARLAL